MKKIVLTSLLAVFAITAQSQVITIAEARSKALGTNVKVRGIVLSGDEMGTVRAIDDGTGGISIFSSNNSQLRRGDSIEVSGTLGHFNNLLQISSGVTFTKLDSNKTLPAPIEFNSVSSGAFSKAYESRLIKINGVSNIANISGTSCTGTASVFAGNKNYCINNSSSTPLRVSNPVGAAGDIINKNVPSGTISVVGILGMFNKGTFTGGTTTDPAYYDTTLATGFQLLVRLYEDFVLPPKPNLLDDPHPTWNVQLNLPNITTNSIDIEFNTQNLGTTKLEYGISKTFGFSAGDSLYNKKHSIKLTGLLAGTIYYIRATSTNPNGVSISKVTAVATKSNSSGNIKVYFNNPVDTSVATFSKAVFLNKTMDDTLVAYINRAKSTLDLAIYNLNSTGLADFVKALNDAHARGVLVRVVYDGTTANIGLNNLDPNIGIIGRNGGTGNGGIMHNKFMVIDANDTNPNIPIVWGGSTNMTRAQIETDNNNIVFVQDQSLARTYTLEFNEMFGSSGATPDGTQSKFGAAKSDDTPHDFIIAGKYFQQYFSPSDRTTSYIISSFNTAQTDAYFMSMSFTRSDIATAIRNRVYAGVYGAGIVNDTSSGAAATVFNILSATNVLGTRMIVDNQSGIMHQKTAIVDANNCGSDPQVVTGSHNWSTNAENDNDENIMIIHDADIANQYYQAFSNLYKTVTGSVLKGIANFTADNYMPARYSTVNFSDRSTFKANNWTWDFGDGQTANTASPSHSYSSPGPFVVKLISSDGSITDSSLQTINVSDNIGVSKTLESNKIHIFPNPTQERIYIQAEKYRGMVIWVYDIYGKIIAEKRMTGFTETIDLSDFSKGLYIVSVNNSAGEVTAINKVLVY